MLTRWAMALETRRHPSVTFERNRDAAVAFAVLAELDLGRDAANLHRPGTPEPPWARSLTHAYQAAPNRLHLHALPLHCVDGTFAASLSAWGEQRSDPRDRAAATLFLEAFEARAGTRPAWHDPPHALVPIWTSLRQALWSQRGEPPPLRVLDCPALGRHGRAGTTAGGRVVATSLGEPEEHVLCQVLHEEIHAITDPVVGSGAPRDTRVGHPGFAQHAALELAAVEVGEALLAARAPTWLPAYARWRRRSGA